MNNTAVATGKRVVVFAGSGSLASSTARHLAAAGATVLLSGRSQEKTEKVAEQIRADGGNIETAAVDPTDPDQVRAYLSKVAADGPVDFAFNGIGLPGPATGYGIPYDDLDPKVMTDAVALVLGSQFLTAREAARVMQNQGSGSIATIASTNGRSGRPHTGGIGVIAGALEALARSLASEYGPHGIPSQPPTRHPSGQPADLPRERLQPPDPPGRGRRHPRLARLRPLHRHRRPGHRGQRRRKRPRRKERGILTYTWARRAQHALVPAQQNLLDHSDAELFGNQVGSLSAGLDQVENRLSDLLGPLGLRSVAGFQARRGIVAGSYRSEELRGRDEPIHRGDNDALALA